MYCYFAVMGAEGEQAIPDRSISPETASRLCPEQRRDVTSVVDSLLRFGMSANNLSGADVSS